MNKERFIAANGIALITHAVVSNRQITNEHDKVIINYLFRLNQWIS